MSEQDRLDMEALEQSFRQVGSLYQDDYDAYQLSLSRDRERLLTEEAAPYQGETARHAGRSQRERRSR
ncbi:hypothetical protein [Streptococcus pluranimalium]|uniref:hypothetical protein n=1 Tax=Streptococcus pluranimalium TaxID=82348 RepID=UPI001319BAAB|nr:hypothetical protein [Streptococcus pluranimalium]